MSKTPIAELIEALQIFEKYIGDSFPTGCEHDVMYVYVNPENVSEADVIKLDELGFSVDQDIAAFRSYTYGSA